MSHSLSGMAAVQPEQAELPDQRQAALDPVAVVQPAQHGAQVVMLVLEPCEPRGSLWTTKPDVRVADQGEEIVGVPVADGRFLATVGELLGGVLTDRLQHREAWLRL